MSNSSMFSLVKLGRLISLEYGKALESSIRSGEGVPVYGSGGVVGRHEFGLVGGPGIIVGRKGSVGSVYWSSENFWPIDTAYYLAPVCRERSCDRWLYWLLCWLPLKNLDSSTGIPGLNRGDVYRLDVPWPTFLEQCRVAEVLDAVEQAIDGLVEGIEKQEMIRTGAIDDLFSGRRYWLPGCLNDHISNAPKNGFSPSEVSEWTGVRVLGLGCLTPDGFSPRQLKNAPSSCASISSALLEDGDFLITRANTRDLVGLVGRYRDVGGVCLYPDLMMRLRLKKNVLPEFIESSLRHPYMRHQIMAQAVGTSESMVKISSAIVRGLRINMPSIEEQRRIVSVIRAHDERIAAEKARLEKLRKLKAGLMDDLLTGRVRVNQIDELPV